MAQLLNLYFLVTPTNVKLVYNGNVWNKALFTHLLIKPVFLQLK